jgi:galactose mutarotase-like enzyme
MTGNVPPLSAGIKPGTRFNKPMTLPYETAQQNGHTLDLLTNPGKNLRIAVSRTGAELVSLARRRPKGAWEGFLYRDNDLSLPLKGWKNHATVMGYYLHRLLNNASLYRGRPIAGGTHGLLRNKTFASPEVSPDSLTYRLEPDAYTAEEYPFRVAFALTYRIAGETLEIIFQFENREDVSTHVSFGLHPGFACASLGAVEILLPPGRYRRLLAPGNFLSGNTEEIQINAPGFPFEKAHLEDSYLLEFVNVPDRKILFRDPLNQRRLVVDPGDAPYLTIWSDGNPFVCLEPCWGLPDHHTQRPFEQKEGIQEIPPRGTLTKSFRLHPQMDSTA